MRYFVGDLHIGHKLVAELRGFESTEDHDTHILNQLEKLTTGDQLWILGDISSGKPQDELYALYLLSQLEVPMHLIWGNHDSGSSIHRSAHKMQKRFTDVFESVHDFARMRFNGENVLLSHYPYARSGDGPGRNESRYIEYRLQDNGMPLIHAHTHHTEPHMSVLEWDSDLQQLCVSWDVFRKPLGENNIDSWIKSWKEFY